MFVGISSAGEGAKNQEEHRVIYNPQKLHKSGHFRELLATNQFVDHGRGRCSACGGRFGSPGEDRERIGMVAGIT
jgi:hypothetical protein